jgi:hypothetical protein
MQWAFPAAVAALLLAGCGKVESLGGPGLPACKRDPAVSGCKVTWSGSDNGSSSCNNSVTTSASVPWKRPLPRHPQPLKRDHEVIACGPARSASCSQSASFSS